MNHLVSPAKHPNTITPPPPCFTVGTTYAEIIRSPTLCHTAVGTKNVDSSDQRTDFHWSNVHCLYFLAQASLFLLSVSFICFFAAIRTWRPDSRSLLWTVDVEICIGSNALRRKEIPQINFNWNSFQVTTSWSWLRKCQECEKLSSRQRVLLWRM